MLNKDFNNIILVLFKKLGQRLSKEPRLSDVTWAMAQTIPDVASSICKFFEVDFEIDSLSEVRREFYIGKYPVDFAFIFRGGEKFFLENKIWDRDYHIEKYSRAIQNQTDIRFGIISHRPLSSSDKDKAGEHKWKIRYWKDFIIRVEDQDWDEYQPLIDAYIAYVKEVCCMLPINKVQFTEHSLRSLYYFNNLLEKIIKSSGENEWEYEHYKPPRSFNSSWSGHYYCLKKRKTRKEVWSFFGIDYEEEPTICITLDEDWNDKIIESLQKDVGKGTDYFEIIKCKDGITFEMYPEHFKEFNQAELNDQESRLKHFFDEVNNWLKGILD